MSLEIQLFSELPEPLAVQTADILSAYTKGELGEVPQMLPVEPTDIRNKYMGFVALQAGAVAGYVGAMTPEIWNGKPMVEVGSLLVLPEHRKQGIAHKLVAVVTKSLTAEGDIPYAFCNPKSKTIFADAGYINAAYGEVPQSAFSLCSTCPAKPVNGCCDEVMILKGSNI